MRGSRRCACDRVDLLTTAEKPQGMAVLAPAARGLQLTLWKKRGVFRTMVSRHYGPGNTIPASPRFAELALHKEDTAEIDYRFEALPPYRKPGAPAGGKRTPRLTPVP